MSISLNIFYLMYVSIHYIKWDVGYLFYQCQLKLDVRWIVWDDKLTSNK